MTLDELLEQFDEVLDSGIKTFRLKLSRQRALLQTVQISLPTQSARRTVLSAVPKSAQRL